MNRADYAVWMKTIHNSLSFDLSDTAKYRLHVLKHYYQFGWKAAINAFGVKKSTLYDWKQTYERSSKRLDSLIPHTTRPHSTRTMKTDWRLVEFIKQFREQHGNIDRAKIKLFLDQYALELGVKSISASVIGKIIRRHHWFDGKKPRKKHQLSGIHRIKYAPQIKIPGYLQMDSIIVYVLGKRYTFISLIDVCTKYAFAKRVGSSISDNSRRVLVDFLPLYPYRIHTIQTDNGHEFLGDFHRYCVACQINHEFIYPRSPRINGVVERFNRTLQEEFINRHDELDYDLPLFEGKLDTYLHWYNHKRPHMSLKYQSPIQFMTSSFPKSM
jgi:hypothetical protein